jgi:hypothetical protein
MKQRRSEYLLGRREIQRRLTANGHVTVAAIRCLAGSPEEWIMYLETKKRGRQRKPVLYRINVRLKEAPAG